MDDHSTLFKQTDCSELMFTTPPDTTDPQSISPLSLNSESTVSEWEDLRKTREEAQRIADQKLIDAVCAVSLSEFKERERILQNYAKETEAYEHTLSSVGDALSKQREQASVLKREAVQRVLDSKLRIQEIVGQVKEASLNTHKKNCERIVQFDELEERKRFEAQQFALSELEKKRIEAIQKRHSAEAKAKQAQEKAEAMREKAFAASRVVREISRKHIELNCTAEEENRLRELEEKNKDIENLKTQATIVRIAATEKAKVARERAERLGIASQKAKAAIQNRIVNSVS